MPTRGSRCTALAALARPSVPGSDVKRGALIAFEGIDGTGKTTQIEVLATRLRERGHGVRTTREPTDGPHGTRIRELARAGRRASPEEELAWFRADRREHVAQVIEPALAAGEIVLTDRYTLSTVAYQGARGFDPAALLEEAEREFPHPDLALLFWLSPAVALERIRARGGPREIGFEEEAVLNRVAAVFDALECSYLTRIDANGSPAEVSERMIAAVDRSLPALEVALRS